MRLKGVEQSSPSREASERPRLSVPRRDRRRWSRPPPPPYSTEDPLLVHHRYLPGGLRNPGGFSSLTPRNISTKRSTAAEILRGGGWSESSPPDTFLSFPDPPPRLTRTGAHPSLTRQRHVVPPSPPAPGPPHDPTSPLSPTGGRGLSSLRVVIGRSAHTPTPGAWVGTISAKVTLNPNPRPTSNIRLTQRISTPRGFTPLHPS